MKYVISLYFPMCKWPSYYSKAFLWAFYFYLISGKLHKIFTCYPLCSHMYENYTASLDYLISAPFFSFILKPNYYLSQEKIYDKGKDTPFAMQVVDYVITFRCIFAKIFNSCVFSLCDDQIILYKTISTILLQPDIYWSFPSECIL